MLFFIIEGELVRW